MKNKENFSIHPLFDSYENFRTHGRNKKISSIEPVVLEYLQSFGDSYVLDDYKHVKAFLYSKSQKSEGTYNSLRIDVERLMLWCWVEKEKSIVQLRRSDIEEYADFVHSPSSDWISIGSRSRFLHDKKSMLENEGNLLADDRWRPFSVPEGREPNSYKVKANTMKQMFASLSSLYDYLVKEDYALGNLIPSVRSDSPYVIKDKVKKPLLRLSQDQWDFLLESLTRKADEDPAYERVLFVFVTMKVLFLRISELTDRRLHSPSMGDFYLDDGDRLLFVHGKKKTERSVTIPDEYLPYLARYRRYRKLTPDWPASNETHSMLCTSTGKGRNLSTRQLRRIMSDAFNEVCEELLELGKESDAEKISNATTHWLRHTGASMDIEAGRPLKHVSEELGHSSMTFTDAVYIQSDKRDRISSGKNRRV